jgi:hypothetical protein
MRMSERGVYVHTYKHELRYKMLFVSETVQKGIREREAWNIKRKIRYETKQGIEI